VPHAFVHLYPELESAVDQSLVLTTTERLRRNLIRAYNDTKLATGQTAWATPRVLTIGTYLGILHRELRRADPRLPLLVGAEAEYALFRSTAPAGAADLVPLAQEAWTLCHQWGIPIEVSEFGASENGLVFAEWSERLSRRLSSQNAITRAELVTREALSSDEDRITCLAFEQVPTGLRDWLNRQPADVCYLDAFQHDDRKTRASRTSFDTSEDELAAISRWARRLLETSGQSVRIGIIVPDLGSRYGAVLRQFTAELDPELRTGTQGLLDIGSGTPLAAQPIWAPAKDWLRLCVDTLSAERARRCLNSPYLALPRLPSLPANLAPVLSLQQLDRQLDLAGLDPEIVAMARALRATEQSLAGWIDDFGKLLKLAGWTGQSAGSVQFQAWQEIGDRLDGLSRWADQRSQSGRDALQQIDGFLSSLTFAPERPAAPIQIMGYLESTGLDFTHLWVSGLDDESWPRLPAPNPFLPMRLLKAHQLPRTTPAQEAEFARARLEQWQHSTDNLIVSHARHMEESERRPSALITQLPLTERLEEHRPHPGFSHQHGQLEALEDLHGLTLESGSHRGGTGRIRDQATCPFRGYAIHRLGLKEIRQPRGLPDALDRGTLIHEALHRLYENAGNDGMSAAELTALQFGQAADQALARHYGRFPAAFRERERDRLVALLTAWNRLESRREDTAIEEMELGLTAEFGGIGLNLRIDRIDRIGDAHLVIDYKTGRIGNRLTHDRLLDPQLPLYALTDESVQGVLYAEVDEERPRLKGIAALDVDQAGLEPPAGGSWAAQRARWQAQIDTLTDEIRAGFAAVTPFDRRACQNCHLQSLCRVAAVDEPTDEEASSDRA
jgi:probable DNA repair protein